MLASIPLANETTSLQEQLEYIDGWLADHPIPSSEQTQRLVSLSFALQRHSYFSTEAETVRTALRQAETQLANQQDMISEQIKGRAAVQAHTAQAKDTSPSPNGVLSTTSGVGDSDTSNETSRSPMPRQLSSAVQERLEEYFNGSVPPGAFQQLYSTDDESFVSEFDSYSSDNSSLNESDGEGQGTHSDGMVSIRIEPSFEESKKGTLGRFPIVSLAHIAAAPCPPGSLLRRPESVLSIRGSHGGSKEAVSQSLISTDVTTADGGDDGEGDPHARRRQ